MSEQMTAAQRPLRLILPDQKRLCEAFQGVMDKAQLSFSKEAPRAALGQTSDESGALKPIETYKLRSEAALEWICEGSADIAVVGLDTLREFNASAKTGDQQPFKPLIALQLPDIARCSLWLAARPEVRLEKTTDLEGLRIATSYPALLQQLLDKEKITPARIISQKGGVVGAIIAGRADVILEIVETGASLAANGLEKKIPLLQSSAVIVRTNRQYGADKEAILDALVERLAACQNKPQAFAFN